MRGLMIAFAIGVAAAAAGVESSPVTAPLHGGAVTTTKGHAFETLLAPSGVRVFFYTDGLSPAMVDKAAGVAKLRLPDGRALDVKLVAHEPAAGEPTSYFCPMHSQVVRDKPGKCELCGGMNLYVQDHLYGAVDLKNVDLTKVSATIRVTGLGGAQKEATFTPTFKTPDAKAAPGTKGK